MVILLSRKLLPSSSCLLPSPLHPSRHLLPCSSSSAARGGQNGGGASRQRRDHHFLSRSHLPHHLSFTVLRSSTSFFLVFLANSTPSSEKEVKLRFFLCFSSYASILVDFLHFPSHPSVFVRPTHISGRFPANQRRPTTAGSILLFLNSGEALFFVSYLSSFVFHCFVRGFELGFDLGFDF